MSQTYSKKYEMPYLNGFVALVILLVIGVGVGSAALENGAFAAILGVPYFYLFTRFRVVQPNVALVGTLFGKYAGILPHAGFYWLIPFYHTQTVSLKTGNYVTDTLKVNDSSGTPIEIAAAIVYHIENPAAAVLDVENAYHFLNVQSEGALRALATHHPYANDGSADSLTGHSQTILAQFQQMLQERVEVAGISIDEVRFTHLTYAPEIAQAMLQRQQATAIVDARETIVEGAVTMVESALDKLDERDIVDLDSERRASMVSNLLVVLCSDSSTQPVVNTGSLYT